MKGLGLTELLAGRLQPGGLLTKRGKVGIGRKDRLAAVLLLGVVPRRQGLPAMTTDLGTLEGLEIAETDAGALQQRALLDRLAIGLLALLRRGLDFLFQFLILLRQHLALFAAFL